MPPAANYAHGIMHHALSRRPDTVMRTMLCLRAVPLQAVPGLRAAARRCSAGGARQGCCPGLRGESGTELSGTSSGDGAADSLVCKAGESALWPWLGAPVDNTKTQFAQFALLTDALMGDHKETDY